MFGHMPAGMLRVHDRRDQYHTGHSARFARQYFADKRTAHRVADHGEWSRFTDKTVNGRLQPIRHSGSRRHVGQCGVRPKPGRSRYIRRIESLPSNALSSIISERWSTPMPCTNTTGNPSSLPQSRSTAAIAPCVPLLQPGTNRLSHNSGSSSLGVGAIPTAILGFEGLICADVMKREDLSQSRVMTQPPFRWICHAVMMTAEPEHGKSRMLHRPAGHGQP